MIAHRSVFPAALALSLLVHGLLLLWLWQRLPGQGSAGHSQVIERRLGVILRPLQVLRGSEAPLQPISVPEREPEVPATTEANRSPPLEARQPAVADTTGAGRPPDEPPARALDLSLPELPAPDGAQDTPGIFDPGFAGRLRDARRRSPAGAASGTGPGKLADNSRMSGGSWATFVRIGRLCFEVLEADPLDSLSREQWYAVDCSTRRSPPIGRRAGRASRGGNG